MSIRSLRDNKVINIIPKRVHAQLQQHFFVEKTKTIVNFTFRHALGLRLLTKCVL